MPWGPPLLSPGALASESSAAPAQRCGVAFLFCSNLSSMALHGFSKVAIFFMIGDFEQSLPTGPSIAFHSVFSLTLQASCFIACFYSLLSQESSSLNFRVFAVFIIHRSSDMGATRPASPGSICPRVGNVRSALFLTSSRLHVRVPSGCGFHFPY